MKETTSLSVELQKIKGKLLSLPDLVKKIIVKDKTSLDHAHKALMYIKSVRRDINNFCDPNISRLYCAHREALAQKKTFERPLIEAEDYINPQIASYLAELERIRRVAEEKARLEREAALRKVQEEEDARLAEALEAEEKGRHEEADKILDQAPIQAPPMPQTFVPSKKKLKGLYVRKDWHWEPKDPVGFEGISKEWMILVPHKEKIDAYVKEMKEKAEIEGIRIFSKDTTIQRLD